MVVEGYYRTVEGEISGFSSDELRNAYEKIYKSYKTHETQIYKQLEQEFPTNNDLAKFMSSIFEGNKEKEKRRANLESEMLADGYRYENGVYETPIGKIELFDLHEELSFVGDDGSNEGRGKMRVTIK